MRVITDPTIQGMSGRFPKSHLVMNHRQGKIITHAQSHFIPKNLNPSQIDFALRSKAITSTWSNSHPNFKEDIVHYTELYNLFYNTEHSLPLSATSLWTMYCYSCWNLYNREFDLKTLTVTNFAVFSNYDGYSCDIIGRGPAPEYIRPMPTFNDMYILFPHCRSIVHGAEQN